MIDTWDHAGGGMNIDIHAAYRQWLSGRAGPVDAEDAYCAGYELALIMKDEERRRENDPLIQALKRIEDMIARLR